ncbi:tRNA-specific adenosine deaminase 1 isoform X2 [Daktulosphaira vitifoliae]|uniref:tRNA-specific adenosine deaminase 1 isoform X2 n=1 Tax=Daktulosphaira vitifoliae TaxID=58002 RepID=UPI0021A9E9FD|nr:tRNA-specific adenosine deaminase 1 isoform X2 [Daktulosphaira vitifoliae]
MPLILNEEFANKLTQLCFDKYFALPSKGKPIEGKEWTLLSGIVQSVNENNLKVVSLATGTKCIGKNKLTSNGLVLNDSHAEVLCRRALIHYLLGEIKSSYTGNSSIFEVDSINSRLILKPGIKFHLFSSHTPCGDASIFLKDDHFKNDFSETNCEPCIKKQKLNDIYRTGAKCLVQETKQDLKYPGIAYHTISAVRTKPGRGDPTLSVSCSDKILRWNYVGLQGAMLSLLIEPIYLSSITISGQCPYSYNALYRAVVGRLNIPKEKCPTLLQSSLNFQYSKHSSNLNSKACPLSIIWRITNEIENSYYEVLVDGHKQGVTKKTMNKKSNMPLVCKKSLFDIFKSLKKTDNGITYGKVKSEALNYNSKWMEAKKNLGCWTEKPKSLIEFT